MQTVLVVDDERAMRNAMKSLLEAEGFEVALAKSGDDALKSFYEHRPDLVLLDVMMPGMSGIQTCEELRKTDTLVPVIFLTAVPSDTTKVRAFGAGADGYVEKGENPDVLVAHIRAALKKAAATSTVAGDGKVQLGSVTVDLPLLRVSGADGLDEQLTRTEAAVFAALNRRRGEFVGNDEIFNVIHGDGFAGNPAKIRNHISTLRQKLGPARDMIVNNPNAGYRLLP